MENSSLFETAFGVGIVIASEKGICRVLLPDAGGLQSKGKVAAPILVPSPLTERAAEKLTSYFKGEHQAFEDIQVDLGSLSAFRARILQLIRAIPYGDVRSYGEVASMAGAPGAARAIGGAMAANPVPIIIPCHRVIAANGKLTGYTAPGGLTVKKYLLQMEHVEFKGEGVRRKIDGYKQDKIGMKLF